jgi:hypothetical protein
MSEVSQAFSIFLGENVAFISLVSFDLAGAGKGEPFGRSAVSLHFWHDEPLSISSLCVILSAAWF